MIEVLVAATILVMIVMMLGALFQQTSTAWRAGTMRTSGYMQIRAYVGALQRDANAMINANLLPKNLLWRNGKEQEFKDGSLQFYTVSGSDSERSLNFITYDSSGNRKQQILSLNQGSGGGNASWENPKSGGSSQLLQIMPGQSSSSMGVAIKGFKVEFPSGADQNEYDRDGLPVSGNRQFPLYVTVETQVRQSGELYDVGAESAGPDRQWGTKDDIRTFVDKR